MKRVLMVALAASLMAAPAAYAKGGHGHGKHKHKHKHKHHHYEQSYRYHDDDDDDRGYYHRQRSYDRPVYYDRRYEQGRYLPQSYYYVGGRRYSAHRAPWSGPVRYYDRGHYMPPAYRQYVIVQPQVYYLPPPQPGYEWVRVGNDVYLRQTREGVILDVIRNVFF